MIANLLACLLLGSKPAVSIGTIFLVLYWEQHHSVTWDNAGDTTWDEAFGKLCATATWDDTQFSWDVDNGNWESALDVNCDRAIWDDAPDGWSDEGSNWEDYL